MRIFLSLVFSICFSLCLTGQTWEQLNNTPFYDDHSNGFGFNGKGYTIQGTGNQQGNTLWIYTPDTDVWENVGNFPGAPRRIAIGDDWNGKFYYGFGFGDGIGPLNDLWEFDPVDTSFTQLPSCPCIGRTHPALIANNDKIYMGSGSTGNGDTDDWWMYDMITQDWTQLQNIPGGERHHPFFFSYEDKVYVGGGHRTNWLEYNTTTNTWREIDNLPQGRVAGSQQTYGHRGLLIAGDDRTHTHVPDEDTFMSYDSELGEWSRFPQLPNGSRWAPSSFIIDDILYFFGGYSDNIDLDDTMWKFNLTYLGCLPYSDLRILSSTETSADLFWTTNENAESDTLRWRKVGDLEWTIVPNPEVIFSLNDLETCQEYEFQVISNCGDQSSASQSTTFFTKGCGACLDLDYCDIPDIVVGNEFIQEVKIDQVVFTTGSDEGYGNYAVPGVVEFNIGENFDLSLTPGSTQSTIFPLNFSVWIDFNLNGEFEDDELVLKKNSVTAEITEVIEIPESASPGLSRMRILLGSTFIGEPCQGGNPQFGEVEDYCIELLQPTNTDDISEEETIVVHPNPFTNSIQFKTQLQIDRQYNMSVVNVMGETIKNIRDFDLNDDLDLSDLPSGVYFLNIETNGNSIAFKKIIKSE